MWWHARRRARAADVRLHQKATFAGDADEMFVAVAADEQQLGIVTNMNAFQHAQALAFRLALAHPQPERNHQRNDERQNDRDADNQFQPLIHVCPPTFPHALQREE